MIAIRFVLAVLMIVVGIAIIVRTLHFGLAQAYMGIVLGILIAGLGAYRLQLIFRFGFRRQ